ncbi:sensor histidine kinase [Dactylosporangium siamense]|uniref:histidine kinase n=1 Tax=Dactylosporangium siamense TaxID=685454 RepID=A0A919Q001_9ACTN|nr:sensor histidine kinase [Dactylosporangium siamense]GIG51833.1 two-component sensor histidine kinase [Dactylosporangium siamense]
MTELLLTRRLRPVDLYAVDAVLALVAGAALCAYAALESPLDGSVVEPVWVSVLTGAVIGLPVAVRRRFPVGVAVTVSLAATAALATGVIPNYAAAGPSVSLALAFYSLAVATPLRWSLPTAVGCLAAVVSALAVTGGDLWSATGAVAYGMLMTVPGWLIGWTVRERRALAARQSEQSTRQAVAEERLRIARELHDIVAHTMSLIVVKAAVGNHVAEASPQEARDALRVIEATGRGALLEMRRALGMLRDDTPYAPAPGLADLEALAGQSSYGEVDVHLEVGGPVPREAVPESVGLAVYRIVQESLTNVVKHAAPATCRVTVTIGPADVRVAVTDDGRRSARAPGTGHGLIGMRERVASHGGDFTAGPRDGGGFAVSARLPHAPVEVAA